MMYTVKEIPQDHAPSKWGIFNALQYGAKANLVPHGLEPKSIHDSELDAWEAINIRPGMTPSRARK